MHPKQASFRRYSLGLALYTVLVILWGAWVRISRSGAGCGEHWPLCNGELIPGAYVPATWIEFSHRLSTGLYGILVAILVYRAFRIFPSKSGVTRAAVAAGVFTVLEAWIGAQLVLSGWVADDTSLARALFMGLHQINSMLLSGSVFLVWMLAGKPIDRPVPLRAFLVSPRGRLVLLMFTFLLVISMSGAVASLAGTLFPSQNLVDGLTKDFAEGAHPVLRYRIWHPFLAILLASTLAGIFWPGRNPAVPALTEAPEQAAYLRSRRGFLHAILTTVCFGIVTLFLLSPVWMKLVHLGLAHGTWFAAIALACRAADAWAAIRSPGDRRNP